MNQITIKVPPPPKLAHPGASPLVQLPPPPPGYAQESVDPITAFGRGLQWSATGLAVRGKLPTEPEWQPEGIIEKAAMSMGQVAGDFPFAVLGGILGTVGGAETGPGAAVTGAAGAFAMPELVRSILIEGYNSGEIEDVDDFIQSLKRIGLNTIKSAVIGAITGGAGKYGGRYGTVGKLGAEYVGLTGATALVEREVPTVEDFAVNAIVIGGLEGSLKAGKVLKNLYKKTGRHPRNVAVNPDIVEDIVADIEGRFGQRKVTVTKPFGLSYEQLARREGIQLPPEKPVRAPAVSTVPEGEPGATPAAPAPTITIPTTRDPQALSMWFLRLPESEQARLAPAYEARYTELTRDITPERLQEVYTGEQRALLEANGYTPDQLAYMTVPQLEEAVAKLRMVPTEPVVTPQVRPQPSPYTPESTIFNTPELANNTRYAWRSMGEKEYNSLMKGEKIYSGDKAATKGNFLASIPESAGQYKGKGKYLVEFGDINIAGNEGLAPGSIASRDNVTRVWKYEGNKWVETGLPAGPKISAPETMPPISVMPEGAPVGAAGAGLPLNEFLSELGKAVKADIGSKDVGVTFQPFRNLEKFLRENKLRLSDTEKQRLTDLVRRAAEAGFSERQLRQAIEETLVKRIPLRLTESGNFQPHPEANKVLEFINKATPEQKLKALVEGDIVRVQERFDGTDYSHSYLDMDVKYAFTDLPRADQITLFQAALRNYNKDTYTFNPKESRLVDGNPEAFYFAMRTAEFVKEPIQFLREGNIVEFRASTEAPATLTGGAYVKGLLTAAKEDVTSKVSGITYQPLRNLDKFLRENKLQLTPEEKARILDVIRNASKKGLDPDAINNIAMHAVREFVGAPAPAPTEMRTIRPQSMKDLEAVGALPIREQQITSVKSVGLKWYQSTPYIFRKLPEARAWARKIVDANLKADYEIGVDRRLFETIFSSLDDKQLATFQQTYDKVVNLLAAKKKPDAQIIADRRLVAEMAAADPVVQASLKVAGYYSTIRESYIDSRLEMFKMRRGSEATAALEVANIHDVSGSRNLEFFTISESGVLEPNPAYAEIANKHNMTYNRLEKMTKEYYKIVNWGLEAYRTRIEKGMFKIVLKQEGKSDRVLGFEQTRLNALDRAKELSESGKLKGEEIVIQRVPWRKPDPTKPGRRALRGMDMFDALTTYSYIMRKKIHYDPLSFAMRREFRNDSGHVFYSDYVRSILYDQLADSRGMYSIGDKVADSIVYWMQEKGPLKDTPMANITPGVYGRVIRGARWAMSNIKLGYRPMMGAFNLFWGVRNVYVKNGAAFVKAGMDYMRTDAGKRLINANEWALGMDLARSEAGISKTALSPLTPVYWFSKPEPFIRKLALTTNYLYARNKLGLNEAAAQAYAREGVRTQAWLYNNAALPKLLRGQTRKAIFQFKSAMAHQYEFVRTLTPKQLVRFVATEALISGPRGLLLFVKSLPFLAAFGVLDDLEEWLLKRKVPESVPVIGGQPYTFGVPGLVGLDVSQAATMQFLSNNLEDNFGPTISTMVTAYKNTIGAAAKGFPMDFDPIVRTAPFMNNFLQFMDSLDPEHEGWVYSDYGKKYKVGGWYERILLGLGGSPMERTKQTVLLRNIRMDEERIARQKREVYDRIMKLKPTEQISESLLGKAVEYGITSEGLRRRILLYNMDPKLRETLRTEARRRAHVMGLYEAIE